MKNEQDKKLDDLFRKRLENPDQQSGYREDDWDALENMLNQRKKRRGIVYLWPIISSVAAFMLFFLGWWLFNRKADHINLQQKVEIAKINTSKVNNSTLNDTSTPKNNRGQLPKHTAVLKPEKYLAKNRQSTTITNGVIIGEVQAHHTNKNSLNNKGPQLAAPLRNAIKLRDSVSGQTYAKTHPLYKGPALSPQVNNSNTLVKNEQIANLNHVTPPANNTVSPILLNDDIKKSSSPLATPRPATAASANTAPVQPTLNGKIAEQTTTAEERSNAAMMKLLAHTSNVNNNRLSTKTQASFKPRFTGGIIGAQDINGAGSFKQGKLGSKAGLVFAAGVSQKFTISTGAVYSSTPYAAGSESFDLPYQLKVSPVSLTANCQMLDIPINIGYRVYLGGKNTISLGTGLSSYIMLQQHYNFVYAGSSGVPPTDYSVPNSSSYLFKILNLNATYERQVSSKASITIQPYLKLPLADIGYSQVKLQTTGVAVGLSWSLDSSQP